MACGLFALLLSIVLLHVGLTHMGLRYLVCFIFGYLLFLLLVRLWASRTQHVELDPGIDLPAPGGGSDSATPHSLGSGGEFGGGGASGSWEGDAPPPPAIGGASLPMSEPTPSSDLLPDFPDLDEGWLLALPVVLLIGVVVVGSYIVSVAPILFAEVALDVALAAGAYRGAARLDLRYWASGAFRRTWVAALCLAVLVAAVGFGLEAAAPGAHSIGAALLELWSPGA